MTPLGNGDRYRNHPLLRDLDLPPFGGDDKASGDIVGSVDLPSGALGTPMTYMLDGRQYIGLTVGGEAPFLIALALLFERAGGGRRAGVPGGQDDLERAN